MGPSQNIPVPFARRVQQLRSTVLPLLTFAVAATLTVALWRRHQATPNAVGEVESTELTLASPVAGTLVPPQPVRLHDQVYAGQVVAKLDDRAVRATLATLRAELGELRAELEEAAAADDGRPERFAYAAAPPGVTAFVQVDAAPADMPANTRADAPVAPGHVSLSRLRASIAAHEARIRELELQAESLEIRAPMKGTVTAIYRRAGQVVQPGEPVVAIVADGSDYITAYLRQRQNIKPSVGMPVDVRARSARRQPVPSMIEQVGPRVERVPPQQLYDPQVPEWGIPVRIKLPAGFDATPGELVDVTIRR